LLIVSGLVRWGLVTVRVIAAWQGWLALPSVLSFLDSKAAAKPLQDRMAQSKGHTYKMEAGMQAFTLLLVSHPWDICRPK
jgi:hypothetical protein